ncbi:MAG TPA: 2-oxo acid dehydrogenase subunit E2, partial [Pseudonocardia sp.]|nr:2-oxo acid dehydrogenase subunit E2 [Pseudonocardia sp.]
MPSSSTSSQAGQFGPNEWLVEEMYQRFLDDPTAVDPAWHDFFADYRPGDGYTAPAGNGTPAPAAAPEKPVAEKSATQKAAAPDKPAASEVTPGPNGQVKAARVAAPARPAPEKPAAGSASKAARPAPAAEEGTTTPLRGAASMVVKNMEASLEVPTATSVRAVPAKLLADNRLVINNQLRRTRGGKISFTHLIGYAVVRALAEFPVMNRHFTEFDGRPTVVAPDHVNLGLAIDLPGKGGGRSLVVVSIKGCEGMNFAQFWSAYEAIVHKARTGALKGDDFTGTTLTLTNPGTLGTNHSVPRLMQGQGAIIGVGAMEYPAEFQG